MAQLTDDALHSNQDAHVLKIGENERVLRGEKEGLRERGCAP